MNVQNSFLARRGIPTTLLSALAISFVLFASGVQSTKNSESDTKVRVRHVNSDLCLKVANDEVVASEYQSDASFWWETGEDDQGFVYFTNGKKFLTLVSKGKNERKLVASEGSLAGFENAWLFTDHGAIYSMVNSNSDAHISLHVPKNAKSGDPVQLSSNYPGDAFVMEPIPESGDPVRLTVEESYHRHLEEFKTPPGTVN